MPGGRTQATMSRSFSHADVRLPRFALTAWWSGVSTWNDTNTIPTNVERRGRASRRCWTAPTSVPTATANSAGNRPRRTSTTHHSVASGRDARNSAAKNPHS